jgi:TatA/E family protein of Tat protein translocase
MGLTNPLHLAFIAVIALIVLGPKRLPDLARSLGHGMREFREALSSESRGDAETLPEESPAEPFSAPEPPASSPAAQSGTGAGDHQAPGASGPPGEPAPSGATAPADATSPPGAPAPSSAPARSGAPAGPPGARDGAPKDSAA